MKGKNVARIISLTLIITFIALYITQLTGYYEYTENKKTTLTDEAITRFEEDVRQGKTIEAKNYLQEENNYNNNASKLGMKLSNIIETGFDKIMNAIFKEVDKAINSSNN